VDAAERFARLAEAAPVIAGPRHRRVFIGYAIAVLLGFGTMLTWVERKQAAVMADRIGANRAYIRIPFTQIKLVWLGLFHGMADGLKMLLKEDFKPRTYDWYAYAWPRGWCSRRCCWCSRSCPSAARSTPALCSPLAGWFGDRTYPMQIARLDAGLLIVFAFSGIADHRRDARRLVVVQQVLAARRAARRLADDLLRAGAGPHGARDSSSCTARSTWSTIVRAAVGHGARVPAGVGHRLPALRGGPVPHRRHRGEQAHPVRPARGRERADLAGYFTEYSAMKMGLFMFAEFIEIAIISALFTTLFLGGYNLPYMNDAGFAFPGGHGRRCPTARGGAPDGHLPRQGVPDVQLPDPRALDAAALPLRPGAALRLEVPAAARRSPTSW
jgi:NADH-quinone oxidoreductase subunit H